MTAGAGQSARPVDRPARRERTRHFTLDDQLAFATLSGDVNPLHVDPVVARRLLFGQPVVHGVHLLLWGLDVWLTEGDGPVALTRIEAEFRHPAGTDLDVRSDVTTDGDARRTTIAISSGDAAAARIRIEWTGGGPAPDRVPHGSPEAARCRDRTLDELAGASGTLDLQLDRALADRMLPAAARRLPDLQLAQLLATTRLVGVECPGLHSVYSHLTATFDPPTAIPQTAPVLRYRVEGVDRRFSLVRIAVESPGMTAAIRAFHRPAPRRQASFDDARALVTAGEFAGQRALVIGGSRGLGEVTTKLLAAGGADVRLTYHRGGADATRVVREIENGGGRAGHMRLDVLAGAPAADVIGPPEQAPTHLYYFPTPFIAPGRRGRFSAERFREFCRYYVEGFAAVFDAFAGPALRGVFYPSSIFVEDTPDNMGEYAAAKRAGEALCAFLERTRPPVRILCPRLPRLATDQTSSLVPLSSGDPLPVVAESVRTFSRATSP